jgi:hypothetical protein
LLVPDRKAVPSVPGHKKSPANRAFVNKSNLGCLFGFIHSRYRIE